MLSSTDQSPCTRGAYLQFRMETGQEAPELLSKMMAEGDRAEGGRKRDRLERDRGPCAGGAGCGEAL